MFKFKHLNSEHLTHSQIAELYEMTLFERLWVGFAILLVAVFGLLDLIEDIQREEIGYFWLVDIGYVTLTLVILGYLWRYLPLTLSRANVALTSQIIRQHEDIEQWKQKASDTMKGFSRLISMQFEEWGLSKAEKEVALLLLKGLSIKEISYVRGTSPGTTRQQSTSLYEKANISSRAELSAFFLEDLLLVKT